jgi:hypothetical protein
MDRIDRRAIGTEAHQFEQAMGGRSPLSGRGDKEHDRGRGTERFTAAQVRARHQRTLAAPLVAGGKDSS